MERARASAWAAHPSADRAVVLHRLTVLALTVLVLGGCASSVPRASSDAKGEANATAIAPPRPAAASPATGAIDATTADASRAEALPLATTTPAITATDVMARVRALTDPRTEGRATGSAGEALAADYVARSLASFGLEPGGDTGGWRHRFTYTAGIALGLHNALTATDTDRKTTARPRLEVDRDWRPLAFSRTGGIAPAPVVFAGYGLVAPAEGDRPAVDEYAGLDVRGRWVMVLRDLPTGLAGELRQTLQRHASLRHKAMIARDRGAVGVIFVNGPRSAFREPSRRCASTRRSRARASPCSRSKRESPIAGSRRRDARSRRSRIGSTPPGRRRATATRASSSPRCASRPASNSRRCDASRAT